MRKLIFILLVLPVSLLTLAQTPKTYTASELLLQLKKLNVLGSVLYIAAHPDDENTRLLAYLANEKLYRTGYLSLTRGDGGQNLIGDEQGIDLGLIRTQELLAARRIDGAEQFFSRAYDFGFCKTAEEAIRTWGHDKILSDVVWVIRKFKPDVIITRFPEDSRAGHGHHAASAILAREAFDAAADPTKFPEQLQAGVTAWQAKRLLWNTFNFGGNNTQSEDQFKLDVGAYNPLLGKGYGEIAATSRSQHKSQGFGVPAQRGVVTEYFSTIKGDKPVNDLAEGVDMTWMRTGVNHSGIDNRASIKELAEKLCKTFNSLHPDSSLTTLIALYKLLAATDDSYWKGQKMKEVNNLIEACSGIFLEAVTTTPYVAQGDSLKLNFTINNRLGAAIDNATVHFKEAGHVFNDLKPNVSATASETIRISKDEKLTQPYWLENKMTKGSFNVTDQQLIGKAENDPLSAVFTVNIQGIDFIFQKPVRYKFTDPVKGELYQPLVIVPPVVVNVEENNILFRKNEVKDISVTLRSFVDATKVDITAVLDGKPILPGETHTVAGVSLREKGYSIYRNQEIKIKLPVGMPVIQKGKATAITDNTSKAFSIATVGIAAKDQLTEKSYPYSLKTIRYDHIPDINYFTVKEVKAITLDLITQGKLVGYIPGAGDKLPQALEQMGYKVVVLKETDLATSNLEQFDAIVTGVRAYNTNEWLSNSYDALMQYVKEGGVLLTQYNTNNSIGPVKAKIAPYPFTIGRNRVTDEEAKVRFLLPAHPVLNYPNKITEEDFKDWIQERSIYNAEDIDSNYQRILSMKDADEHEQEGSLLIANYGKGRFVYTGLVFFRELPAGVPGAYRLFANLIANKRQR